MCNAVFVDDVVTALMLAATNEQASGEAFLVSGPAPLTWGAFFSAFERMLGLESTVSMSRDEALDLWKRSSRRPWLLPETLRTVRQDADLRDRLLSTREGRLVRRTAQRLLPERFLAPERWRPPQPEPAADRPIAALRPDVLRFLESRAIVSNDKARRVLGYNPVFDIEAGMWLTEQWARHEGLLGPEAT